MKSSKLRTFLSQVNRDSRIGQMCLGLIACLMLSPFVYFAVGDVQFMVQGVSVEARISGSPTLVRTKFLTCYRYPVEYDDTQGEHRMGTGLVRDATLQIGDTIRMRYLRANPARARTESGIQRSWPTQLLALVAVLVFCASVWTGVKGIREIFRKLREGDLPP